MHQVDSDGYITVLGERRFVDRSFPTYEGTVDGANWNNAVQGEISSVITHAGLTLRSSGAADAAAGWTQLKEAIFESAAIGSSALSEVSLSKLSAGDTDVDDSSIILRSSSLSSQYTELNTFYVEAHAGDTTTNTDRVTELSGWGITHTRGTAVQGSSTGQTLNDGLMSFDISAKTWALSGDGKYYYSLVNMDTGLKWESGGVLGSIFSCYSASITGTSGSYRKKYDVDLDMVESSGKILIQSIYRSSHVGDPSSMSDVYLHVRGMASPL